MSTFDKREIRQWLSALPDPEFKAFCIDYFEETYHQFSGGMDRNEQINVLFLYVEQKEIVAAQRKSQQAAASPRAEVVNPGRPKPPSWRSRGAIALLCCLVAIGCWLGGWRLLTRTRELEDLAHLQSACLAGADCGELAERLRRRCAANDPLSCVQLGLQTRAGKGTEKNDTTAADYFDAACRQHRHPLGCFYLGFMYEKAWGRTANDAETSRLYKYACDAGVWKACTSLGYLYERGRYIENGSRIKSTEKAVDLYRKSCDANYVYGCLMLGYAYLEDIAYPDIVGKEEELFGRACNGGLDSGCSALGQVFEDSKKNMGIAVRYYEKACAWESRIGCYNAARYYRSQGKQDMVAALLQRGCTLGHGLSCADLGELHERGIHYSKDEVHASELYRAACEERDEAKGCLLLSRLYERKDGGGALAKTALARACLLFRNQCAEQLLDHCAELQQICPPAAAE